MALDYTGVEIGMQASVGRSGRVRREGGGRQGFGRNPPAHRLLPGDVDVGAGTVLDFGRLEARPPRRESEFARQAQAAGAGLQ